MAAPIARNVLIGNLLALLVLLGGCGDSASSGAGDPGVKSQPAKPRHPALLDPALATEKAPDTFLARFVTAKKGEFTIECQREWSPRGADRFYNLVKVGFFDGGSFFRCVKDPRPFMVQFGISSDPDVQRVWGNASIHDDRPLKSNRRGYVTFAKAGPNTRSTQVFINYGNNTPLDQDDFAPFGRVSEGMEVVDALYGGYGDVLGRDSSFDMGSFLAKGRVYLEQNYPLLDYIDEATIVE